MKNLFGVVEHMRQLNLRTVEHLEKQKLRNTSLANQLDRLHIQLSQFQDKCANKDLLIRTVVHLAQAMTNEFSVTSLVRSLRETTVKPSFVRKSTSIDFNLETLCQYLESSAIEILRKKQDPEVKMKKLGLGLSFLCQICFYFIDGIARASSLLSECEIHRTHSIQAAS